MQNIMHNICPLTPGDPASQWCELLHIIHMGWNSIWLAQTTHTDYRIANIIFYALFFETNAPLGPMLEKIQFTVQ